MDWWLESPGLARREVGSPGTPAVWIGVGVPPDFLWNEGLWVNSFVGKARCPLLETQRHQQVLVAEGVKHDDLGHRLWEQLHRDSFGFKAFHILG